MHPFFTVSSSEIRQLSDEQARELVAQLSKAELSKTEISTSSISWGGDQRATDGGIDVSVQIKGSIKTVGYIPRATTGFQVKAENYPPSKILEEMAPDGVLRDSIIRLMDEDGAYIIISTKDNCSFSSLDNRKKKMEEAVRNQSSSEKVLLDFYDSQKMADWASNYPGIVVWIKDCLGGALQAWKPYGPWAYKEYDVTHEYLLDNKVKVSTPRDDTGLEVNEALNRLRGDLNQDGASVRIVGLSGVGKTRLVQALFDDRIITSNPALSSGNVIYTDLSNSPSPLPNALLEALQMMNSDCVVVIDNCGQDIHRKLTEIIKKPGSKLKIVTVEYDIRDHQPEDTACYRLEGSSNELIDHLLRRHFNSLSNLDINKIVDFSDGNARVALALASTSEAKDQLANLQDQDLFQRLFHQKHSEDNELQRCAEASSLLYSFDAENQNEGSELGLLAGLAEVSIIKFYRYVSELQMRGLIQARGKWRAVLPHAIANRLALTALQLYPSNLLIKWFVIGATERVAKSFSRRLGYLHDSLYAQKIVNSLLEPSGYLGDVSDLNMLQWEIFENLAPVNQSASLDAILRVVESNKFPSMEMPRIAVKLLRSLAYESEFFLGAVRGLMVFALAETPETNYEDANEHLKSLFYSNMSGTIAPPELREAFIRELLVNPEPQHYDLGLTLLEAALEIQYPSTMYQYDFGALKRSYGWVTQNGNEINRWYSLFIELAIEIGKTDSVVGLKARELLGSAFRGLWVNGGMEQALTTAATEFSKTTGWINGWLGLRSVIQFDRPRISNESLSRLKLLEKIIEPKSINDKIQAKVLTRGDYSIDYDDLVDESPPLSRHHRAFEEAMDLGRSVGQDKSLITDFQPFVIADNNRTNKVWAFGIGLGESTKDARYYLDQIRPLYQDPIKFELDFQLISGLLQGGAKTNLKEIESFLDEALVDEVWSTFFIILQIAAGIEESGYRRILKSFELGKVPIWRYSNLCNGRALDKLAVSQIANILNRLSTASAKGLEVAIDILYMVIYAANTQPTKPKKYNKELRAFSNQLLSTIDWGLLNSPNEHLLRHLQNVIEFALDGYNSSTTAPTVALERLIQFEMAKETYSSRVGFLMMPYLSKYPLESLDLIYKEKDNTNLYRLLTVSLVRNEDYATYAVPDSALIEWCNISPRDRFKFAISTCKIFENLNPSFDTGNERVISNIAIQIFNIAPEKAEIMRIIVQRFTPYSWSGSRSAIMLQRLSQLDLLNPSQDTALQSIIDVEKVRFSEAIEKEILYERIRERPELESFE